MPLTFREIKELVFPYAGRTGKNPDTEEVAVFARQVMKYLLWSGDQAAFRKLCIIVQRGCLVLPPEVEIPLKVKINHKVSEIWNKWFSFHSVGDEFDRSGSESTIGRAYYPASSTLIESGEETPLAYGMPEQGSIIGVMSTCEEATDSYLIVEGKDRSGREIYTSFNGEQVVGEKFRLAKNEIRYGQVCFGTVSSVLKPITNGYISIFAVNPHTKQKTFLADYSPSMTKPMFKKWNLNVRECPTLAHVSILCRVKLKDTYTDNEVTLFDNELAVILGAQQWQAQVNNDLQTAAVKDQAVGTVLDREAGYKKKSASPLDIYHPTSGNSIRGLF